MDTQTVLDIDRIPIHFIKISDKHRIVNKIIVDKLIVSIRDIGLQYPITVWMGEDGTTNLLSGRHRLEAVRAIGDTHINAYVVDWGTWSESRRRLWEVEENLLRADLTKLERGELTAEWVLLTELERGELTAEWMAEELERGELTEEWVRLTEEKVEQVAPLSAEKKGPGRGDIGGIRAAVRDLGIDLTEARRAVKIASLDQEAKGTAREVGLDNNQSALLNAAKHQNKTAQIHYLKEHAKKKAEGKDEDELAENKFNAFMKIWNWNGGTLQQRIRDYVDSPVFDRK
jgi:ParB-like chromosome segregation protein Spo0J